MTTKSTARTRDACYHISVQVQDPDLKARMLRIADKDGRSLNNWLLHYWFPKIEEHVAEMEKKLKLKPIEEETEPLVPRSGGRSRSR